MRGVAYVGTHMPKMEKPGIRVSTSSEPATPLQSFLPNGGEDAGHLARIAYIHT